jgi:hypothetical protein
LREQVIALADRLLKTKPPRPTGRFHGPPS